MSTSGISRRWLAGGLLAAGAMPKRGLAQSVIRHGGGTRLPDPTSPDVDYIPPISLEMIADIYKRMTAAVRVNGRGPYPFVVDTGANQ
jgi:hypothetical protein